MRVKTKERDANITFLYQPSRSQKLLNYVDEAITVTYDGIELTEDQAKIALQYDDVIVTESLVETGANIEELVRQLAFEMEAEVEAEVETEVEIKFEEEASKEEVSDSDDEEDEEQEPETAKIVCPDCGRDDFMSGSGLMIHRRTHNREVD
jgi:Zn finger protein HypA/HybF involved in hydrogenase expression